MISVAISKLVEGKDLTAEESSEVMRELMGGAATPSQMGSFITAMRMKGETEDELYGFARVMREMSIRVNCPADSLDICGTGGDGSGTFNISTAAAFALASAGVTVAKHGNRSISSRSGSADVLAALGIPYDLSPSSVETCLSRTGIGFMFAPIFHESMRRVMDARREIGIRTFFNLLGPMANPAGVRSQLIGVYDPNIAPLMARVMARLGSRRVMVVHGNGMDELSISGETSVVELSGGRITEYSVSPEDFDIDHASMEELRGGTPLENARIMLSILQGERSPRLDIVALNAGAAIYTAGKAASIGEGVEIANKVLENGSALSKLRQFSETCVGLEVQDQLMMSATDLMEKRISTQALVARCGDLTDLMLERVSERGLESMVEGVDRAVLNEPNGLTYIILNRILEIPQITIPEERNPGSNELLSQMISTSEGIAVIGEYKPTSPSTPPLTVPPDPEVTTDAYHRGGMVGLSVLVESRLFGGGPHLFSSIRSLTGLPMLFKDFVISRKQVELAQHLGADSILLIASCLDEAFLDELIHESLIRGLEPIVEVHSEEDIIKMRSLLNYDMVDMIGVNTRDLRTMQVRLKNLAKIRPLLDEGRLRIAESGVRTLHDLKRLKGYDGALIGSMFMSSPDISRSAGEVVSRCREVCA